MDFLTIVTPGGRTFRRALDRDGLRIGRAAASDLPLDDSNVSRHHAVIERRGGVWHVTDAGGKNGTYLNDERIAVSMRLEPGDRLRLGGTTLLFNADGGATPVEFADRALPGAGTTILPASRLAERGPAAPSPAGLAGILAEANEQLVFHRPLAELLETIMDLARRAVPFERGLLLLAEPGGLVPRAVRVPPDETGRPMALSRTVTDRVMRNKESVLTSDATVDERFRGGESVLGQSLRSVICVPLWNERDVIGLIYVDSRHRAGLFTEENLRTLAHLANVAAVKIENARLFEQVVAAERTEQELRKAAEIQEHLLPSADPVIPGYRAHGQSLPCRAVGGDYFDYFDLRPGAHGFGLGDVAGKGLPAALLMCSFQASLRALADLDLAPEALISRLNRLLTRQVPDNRFVTFFFGVLDPRAHSLTWVNAGHNAPCLLRAGGAAIERLEATGPPLGLIGTAAYSARRVALGPGDLLVCFSDGVTEETSAEGEEFGEERLLAEAARLRGAEPREIVRAIGEAVGRHAGGGARRDDTTLVVVERLP